MAPENLCEIKVTITLRLIFHLPDNLHYSPLYTRRDLERIFIFMSYVHISGCSMHPQI